MKKILIATAIGLACMGAHAQDTAKMRWFITGGYSVGGDTLASGTYTSGQTFSIKAGEGFLLSGGLSFPVANRVDLQASVGFHSTSTNATNGKIEFTRMPLELLALYDLQNRWRIGGGIRSATNPKLSTSGVAGVLGSYEFTPSLGTVIEAQYFFDNPRSSKTQLGVNIRFVSESFEEKVSKTKVNGNGFGAGLFAYF